MRRLWAPILLLAVMMLSGVRGSNAQFGNFLGGLFSLGNVLPFVRTSSRSSTQTAAEPASADGAAVSPDLVGRIIQGGGVAPQQQLPAAQPAAQAPAVAPSNEDKLLTEKWPVCVIMTEDAPETLRVRRKACSTAEPLGIWKSGVKLAAATGRPVRSSCNEVSTWVQVRYGINSGYALISPDPGSGQKFVRTCE